MILSPGGVCVVWDYDSFVPGESDEDSNADGENQDSEVNCDASTAGVTEDRSVAKTGGEDGSSKSDDDSDTIPAALTHTVTFKCIGVMREHRYYAGSVATSQGSVCNGNGCSS